MIIELSEYQTDAPSDLKWCLIVPWQKTEIHSEENIGENND
jgi:hypothetical protein